jgi:hypothetical protein
LKVDEQDEISTRTANQIEQIIQLFEEGRGNDLPSIRGTFWAAYNGISEWLGYERGRSQQSRLDSLWFGDSAAINRHALHVALEMAA